MGHGLGAAVVLLRTCCLFNSISQLGPVWSLENAQNSDIIVNLSNFRYVKSKIADENVTFD